MAQPPEAAPLRLQSSRDSAPAQPRVQPTNLDALVEQKHPRDKNQQPHLRQHNQQPQEQQEQHQQQQHHHQHQYQHQNQHYPPQQAPSGTYPPGAPQYSDATSNSASSVARSNGSGGRRSPSISDEKSKVDGILPVDASPDNHASVARSIGSAPTAHGPLNDTQHSSGVTGPAALPDMSNTQPGPGPARQSVTYASPPNYPQAGMSPVSHYMYSSQPIPSDPYRPSPTTLPSMRTLDHRQPQAQPQHGIPMGAHMAGPTMPAPASAHMGYYGVHPSHMYGLPDPNAMRFALAPGMAHDPRIALSGGRHKKEIKRRTKTGCLTCRKRRIKCDEAHPTCNNCKKSKRECLGYDPIFKQQQGPAAIQPAPSTQPSAPPPAPVSAPAVPSSGPHPYQTSYPPPLPSNIVPEPVPSTVPQIIKAEPSYDYSTAIDPALQGSDIAGTRAPRYHPNNTATGTGQGIGDSNDLRGGTPSSSNLSALSQPHSREIMSTHTISPAKKMKVDELLALGDTPPQASTPPPSPEMLAEITKLYNEVYSPGLSLFFESRWYEFAKPQATTTDSAAAMLHNNQSLVSLFTSFIQTISKIESINSEDMISSGHLESSVVWALARLPLSISFTQHQQHSESTPAEDDLWEARGRVQVFEALLSGETLAVSPLSPPPAGNIHPLRRNELEFWYQLSRYLLQENASASPTGVSGRERCLSVMRDLLDGRENRDVLYSIAVLREYTPHWDASYSEQSVPSHLEESDSRSKLAVATRFIRDESNATGGTTNVVRRFAQLAYCAFVRPGANVNRNNNRK